VSLLRGLPVCGIGLAWFREGVDYDLLHRVFLETERRGRDAFGCVLVQGGKLITLAKFPCSYSKTGWSPPRSIHVGDIVIWSCRARPMTERPSRGPETVQPLVYESERLVVAHNGVVANEDAEYNLDTELFVRRYLWAGRDPVTALRQTVGGSAYLMVDLPRSKILAIRDFKPLAKAYVKGLGFFCLSDCESFHRLFGELDSSVWLDFYYSDFEPFTVNEIDLGSDAIYVRKFEPQYLSWLPDQRGTKALALSSGGIDSSVSACIAVEKFGLDLTLCHFDHGQKSEPGERKAVEYLADFLNCDLKVIDLKWLGELGHSALTEETIKVPDGSVRENLKSTICWTPARNLVFASCAMAIAEATGAKWILNGWSLEEEGAYPDNCISFFRALNEVSNYGTLRRPRVVMLEANLMKPQIIRIGRSFGLDFSKLWSCDTWTPNGECGRCGACTLKRLALDQERELDPSRTAEKLLEVVSMAEV